MAEIKVLPKNIAELIAAGEVIERPASVIKELVENAVDAGASAITVEIANGGISYMRVADNGCGIAPSQVRTAFFRHATSKIQAAADLDSIMTLGFRGEALASIAAVSHVEVMTATDKADFGVSLTLEGGIETAFEEIGCPKGTTIIVRDLFYNVPARMKFLKKNITEGNSVAAIVERIALSHPEVSFKLLRDGKAVFTTPGDGKPMAAIYAVLGRDFSSAMTEVDYEEGMVVLNGYTCRPTNCRPNRNGQYFFLNGRTVKSGTIAAALDQAYKHSAMVGRFPACVLNITIPPQTVDVNVHPTKTEVRFSDEKRIFDAVYRAVRQALAAGDKRPELALPQSKPVPVFGDTDTYRQVRVQTNQAEPPQSKSPLATPAQGQPARREQQNTSPAKAVTYQGPFGAEPDVPPVTLQSGGWLENETDTFTVKTPVQPVRPELDEKSKANRALDILPDELQALKPQPEVAPVTAGQEKPVPDISRMVYVGEAFSTYILVSLENQLYFIDKHAAHERIRFEELRRQVQVESQMLLQPLSVTLMREEYAAVVENCALLEQYGLLAEDFGDNTVLVRAVPNMLDAEDVPSLVREIAGNLLEKGIAKSEKIDDILHSIACKSAIKAGYITSVKEQMALAERVLSDNSLLYCPHGRPIAYILKKSQIEKQFGRIV